MLKKILNSAKKDGAILIDIEIAKFQKIVDNLNEGISAAMAEITKNQEQIDNLKKRSDFLNTKADQAVAFSNNLHSMLKK